MTQEELSRQIGKSRSAIANTMRLLDLPDEVMALVKEGKLSAGHARALLGLKNPIRMEGAAKTVMAKNLSVRETEMLVRKLNRIEAEIEAPSADGITAVDYTAELAKKMTSRLGHKVRIIGKGRFRKLEIAVPEDDALDALVTRLCGENIFDE